MISIADISFRLSKLLGNVIISEGGVVPFINPAVSSPQLVELSVHSVSAASGQVQETKH